MAIKNNKEHQIELLQANLQTIRKIAGWTIEEFGDKLGVSKQTISNLENGKTQMSLIQYIAIRAVLDYEIEEHPENEVLPKAIHLLLDEKKNLSEEDYEKVRQAIDTVAAAASGGADETMLSSLFTGMIGTIAAGIGIGLISPLGIVGGVASAFWFKSVMGKDKTVQYEEEER